MRWMPESTMASFALLILLAPLTGCGGGGGGQDQARNQEQGGAQPWWAREDCGWVGQAPPAIAGDIQQRLAAYAEIPIESELSHLEPSERETLAKLVQAAAIMDDVFWLQACPCHQEIAQRLAKLSGPDADAARAYFQINVGPWDRRIKREPFLDSWSHPAGANFYPLDLSPAEKEQITADQDSLGQLTTMVRRDPGGRLVAIPYSQFFADQLGRAAQLLREAAVTTHNESLRRFLLARAEAFLSDDYYESDLLWMDLDSPVEITIGPYETYEDGLFGFKAAFEAFVTVVDPVESERLNSYKGELPWLESQLPIPDAYKNPNRGTESPIRVVDEVFSAGDTRAGIQTIAFNLPNDERVREAKGSKKVLLRNVMNAKFQKILTPIAQALLTPQQLGDLDASSFFLHTLFHEMSHGLGPGRIVLEGRATEVRLELKEYYSTIEEAKADVMGEWAIFQLQRKGYFPASVLPQQAATYLAGLFRSVRFGISEAHGQANAIQFNWLLEHGVISYDEAAERFAIDGQVFPKAIADLVSQICILQAKGDHAAAKDMVERYATMPDMMAKALAKLTGIPVDIKPDYTVAGGA